MSAEEETLPTDRRSADVAIVCSFAAEVAPLVAALDRTRRYTDNGMVFRGGFIDEVVRVAIVEAGSGFAKHRQAAQEMMAEHNPPWIVSAGLSLGLTDDLSAGDVCLANHLADSHGNERDISCPFPAKGRIKVGSHATVDSLPTSVADRKSLGESSKAIACDTTSLAVAQVSHEASVEDRKIGFLSVRSIFNNFEEDLSAEIVAANFEAPPSTGLLSSITSRLRRKHKSEWDQRAEKQVKDMNRFLLGVIRQLAEQLGKRGW